MLAFSSPENMIYIFQVPIVQESSNVPPQQNIELMVKELLLHL